MKAVYFNEPHFPTECALIIRRALANAGAYTENADINHIDAILKETQRDYPSHIAEFKRRLAPLREIIDYIMANIDEPQERLKFYFSPIGGESFSPGQIAASLERNEINLQEMTPENRDKFLSVYFQCSVLPTDTEAEVYDCASLANWLDNQDISHAYKWGLLQMYLHIEKYQKECRAILAKAEKLFLDKQQLWRPILKKCIDEFKEKAQADSSYIENTFHIKFQSDKLEFRPSLAAFNSLSLMTYDIDEIWQSKADFIDVGYMLEDLLLLNSKSDDTGELLYSRLKAISDKRRLAILTALHEKPLCGQEIAERIGLTPATISHHMNELVSNDFVFISKEGTRLNYSFSSKGMQKFIADLSRSFE